LGGGRPYRDPSRDLTFGYRIVAAPRCFPEDEETDIGKYDQQVAEKHHRSAR
jgi:hypothetical protein